MHLALLRFFPRLAVIAALLTSTAVVVMPTAAQAGSSEPGVAKITPVPGQPAVYEEDKYGGGVGLRGKFVFRNGGDQTVARYEYAFNQDFSWRSTPAARSALAPGGSTRAAVGRRRIPAVTATT